MPSVDEARPSHCPACGVASRAVGGKLMLHGHGLRERQCWGPPEVGSSPVASSVQARRYLCLGCRAVIIVVPGEVGIRRRYTLSAIAYAMALYGVARQSVLLVREQVCVWRIQGVSSSGWITLKRWIQAIRDGTVWSCVRRCTQISDLRQVAERAATTVASCWLGRALPVAAAAWLGAVRAR